MDIRTKLVFTLVAVALGSMFVLVVFAFEASRSMLKAQALRQLESVAEGKKDDLERARTAWADRARLISSRTQLRLSLLQLLETGDPVQRRRMVRILDDARGSVRGLLHAAVLDLEGRVLAQSGAPLTGPSSAAPDEFPRDPEVAWTESDGLVVTLYEPMLLDGSKIGVTRVVLAADELDAIARDYTGLGETGETLVVRAHGSGGAEILTSPRRPGDRPADRLIAGDDVASPTLRAVRGESGSFAGVTDHTGRTAWASTRPLSQPGWGVVVKIDAEEAEQPALSLRGTLIRLALSLSAFAVVAGFVLALFISRPIRELASVAGRIRAGEEGLRAADDSDDEIGELARAFNAMTEELVAAKDELAGRIQKREEDTS